jgi:hydroxyethylthiazole kinase
MDNKTYADLLTEVRAKRPLVHHITNYVTVNDCANATICVGASPVMAHSLDEVADMVSMAGALVLNIGTLDAQQVESMLRAGAMANQLHIPIILDPVGVGATRLRTGSAERIIHDLEITVIKGNSAEIATLAGREGTIKGVDSCGVKGEPQEIAMALARELGLTVAVSGQTDIVTDGNSTLIVDNGHPLMGSISGSGCMASSIAGAFNAVSENPMVATAAALAVFGIAGEKAALQCRAPASFKVALLDELYRLTSADVEKYSRIREA